MSESIFGDLDIAAAEDNPFGIPPDTYEATVTKAHVKTSEKGNVGLNIEYTIQGETQYAGRKITEWKAIRGQNDTQEAKERNASYLKQRLSSLGIPESRMNTLDPDDLVGIDVLVSVKEKDGYTNVQRVTLKEGSAAGTFSY